MIKLISDFESSIFITILIFTLGGLVFYMNLYYKIIELINGNLAKDDKKIPFTDETPNDPKNTSEDKITSALQRIETKLDELNNTLTPKGIEVEELKNIQSKNHGHAPPKQEQTFFTSKIQEGGRIKLERMEHRNGQASRLFELREALHNKYKVRFTAYALSNDKFPTVRIECLNVCEWSAGNIENSNQLQQEDGTIVVADGVVQSIEKKISVTTIS